MSTAKNFLQTFTLCLLPFAMGACLPGTKITVHEGDSAQQSPQIEIPNGIPRDANGLPIVGVNSPFIEFFDTRSNKAHDGGEEEGSSQTRRRYHFRYALPKDSSLSIQNKQITDQVGESSFTLDFNGQFERVVEARFVNASAGIDRVIRIPLKSGRWMNHSFFGNIYQSSSHGLYHPHLKWISVTNDKSLSAINSSDAFYIHESSDGSDAPPALMSGKWVMNYRISGKNYGSGNNWSVGDWFVFQEQSNGDAGYCVNNQRTQKIACSSSNSAGNSNPPNNNDFSRIDTFELVGDIEAVGNQHIRFKVRVAGYKIRDFKVHSNSKSHSFDPGTNGSFNDIFEVTTPWNGYNETIELVADGLDGKEFEPRISNVSSSRWLTHPMMGDVFDSDGKWAFSETTDWIYISENNRIPRNGNFSGFYHFYHTKSDKWYGVNDGAFFDTANNRWCFGFNPNSGVTNCQ